MAIVHMGWSLKDIPANAVNVRWSCQVAEGSMGSDVVGPRLMATYETHNGLCLFETERNGYHDSDFYMTYWDEASQSPKSMCFATTRGWTYPCLASKADATPEVWAKYNAWKANREIELRAQYRKAEANKKRQLRSNIQQIATEYGVNYSKLLKLRKHRQFDGMLKLFGKRVRSNFKLSLRNQLIQWANSNSNYNCPFSIKQLQYI
jgi:hypothetical protein